MGRAARANDPGRAFIAGMSDEELDAVIRELAPTIRNEAQLVAILAVVNGGAKMRAAVRAKIAPFLTWN